MKKLIYLLTIVMFLSTLAGCSCEHEWSDATCTEPKICTKCEATEGDPAGHSWTDATCTSPKTCTSCNAIEGESLGHIEGEMKYSGTDNIDAVKVYEAKCERCDKVLDSREEDLESFISDGQYNISPSDLTSRMDNALASMTENTLKAKSAENSDGDFGLVIGDTNTNDVVAAFLLNTKNESIVSYDDKYKEGFRGAMGMIYDDGHAGRILIATVLTFDPSLSFDEAKSVAKSINNKKSYSKNGIKYILTTSGGDYVIAVGF